MSVLNGKKAFIGLASIALVMSVAFAPTASAAASFATETKVKNALYGLAAYDCINNKLVLQDTAIGNKLDSIASSASSAETYIGPWLGDENGMITCSTAITKTLGSGNISENMLGSGKILNGVYAKEVTGEQKIRCNYGIVNSSGNATQSGTYSWPQGYFYDGSGNLQDKRSHGAIEIVFDESGPIRLDGATSDIDATHTLESMRNIVINWAEPSKICQNLVMYTEVYPYAGVNLNGETVNAYTSILATTDGTPFNEWGIHVDDKYHAWVHSNSDKFTHTLSQVQSSTKLKLTSDAKSKLLSNLSATHLGGATDVSGFLNANADAKYILYGRYLFNGDGNAAFACGGISIATDDPNFSSLSATDYWDTSQPYVATVNAYKNGSASNKSSYRTKFGGNGLREAGTAKNINYPGVSGDCKVLAGEFNNISPTSSTAKSQVARYMKVSAVDELPEENDPSTTPGGGSGGTDSEGDDGVYPCLEAAESLGWVLCPVLDFLGRTIDGVYTYVEDNFLVVNADMLSEETHTAWEKFRDFANTIFIIVFLIVILSQVTGFGISNYGIKKVLPRLIAMVILVNISFILCQLAVDVSNIVGAGIKTLLSNLSSVHLDGEISAGGIAAEILSVLGLGAAGALAPSVAAIIASSLATGTMGYWLLMILVTFIGFLIGILFAGILLAARQAGVILLVVLSPVAIVCYALPNTKSIFDKWRRIFMSLLLVYPMCGAIVGGGQFATSLLINNNGGFFYTLIAMLLSIVPFFFIPTLVRTSLNSIGQLGARLSNFGRGMSGRMTGAIRGSERFKDAQRELGLRRDEATVHRLDSLRARGKTLTAGQQRRRARAYARADKGRREDIVGESYRDRGLLRYDEKRREQLEGNLAAKDFDERVSGAKVAYRDDPRMATEEAIVAEHDKLLEEYGNDPNNIQLQSQLRALEEMAMEKGAPGQDLLQRSFARYMTQNKNSWNDNKGLAMSKLGAGMATRYGKELNSSDKGFNTMLNHFAEKKFKLDSFNGDEQSGYSSSYDTKLAGFTAAGMGKATPGALRRGLAALQSGGFRSNNAREDAELRAQAQTLANNATQALNDELIANDLKPAEKGFVQGIASYGASMPGHASVIAGLGQGGLENLSQFVDSTNDSAVLMSLGQNIQDAAGSSHLYGEGETKRIKMIINKINSKTGTSYTFNPASMQIDQNNSSPIMTGASPEEEARLKAEADKKILGR